PWHRPPCGRRPPRSRAPGAADGWRRAACRASAWRSPSRHPWPCPSSGRGPRDARWSRARPVRRSSCGAECRSARATAGSSGTKAHAQLARHDLRQGGLAEAWRAVEQHVIERFLARLGGGDVDLQVLTQLLLADELVERLRAQRELRGILLGALGRDQAFTVI